MTENEAKEMLQAKLACMNLEDLACVGKGCSHDCADCVYLYAQGTREQQEEALRVATNSVCNSGWIPVEDTLPENAKDKGALCPRYLVTTEWGVTEGWYNPDVNSWYVLFWFMTTDYEERNIDFDQGTYPKIIEVPDGGQVKITAWCRLPEPYKKEV